MTKLATIILLVCLSLPAFGQNDLEAYIKDKVTGESVPGASAYFDSLKIGAVADGRGLVVIKGIPDGEYGLKISCIGYASRTLRITFPLKNSVRLNTYLLEPKAVPTERVVVVSSARNNGTRSNSPFRVEVLGEEEVNEEISIRPGNISKLLSETSGIQVQQTSPVSGNVSFRLQGLPGSYTQLLKDGFPYYSGLSSGLSLLQIPPLDLRQVEVINGSFSTLYGDGAVAGIVNLISRQPSDEPEWNLILNGTSRKGADISSFYSNKDDNTGITFLASQSTQEAVDVDGDGFTDIPYFRQVTLNPRLFYYIDESSSLTLGVSSFFENRKGGDISVIRYGPSLLHTYKEANGSRRINSELQYDRKSGGSGKITLKNSVNYVDRDISLLSLYFSGRQIYTYSELSYLVKTGKHSLVMGLGGSTDSFKRKDKELSGSQDHYYRTLGLFAQDDWNLSQKLVAQPGMRLDHHNKYGDFYMPHLSLLYKFVTNGSIRVSSGLGYRIPSIVNLISDRDLVSGTVRFSQDLKAEISRGVDIDLEYRFVRWGFAVAIDQAYFITKVRNAIAPGYFGNPDSLTIIDNSNSSILSRGFDTNLNVGYDELNLFIDYTHQDVNMKSDNETSPLILTPEDKLNITGTFDAEGSWRTGIEAFYTGAQYLDNNTRSPDYWTFGVMAEKIFKSFSLVGNIENIFDERQTKHGPVVLPPYDNPTFMPIYGPLDGMVANVAFKLRLR